MSFPKKLVFVLLLLGSQIAIAQQQDPVPVTHSNMEQQLENLAEAYESETEDDSYLQQYQQFRRHPLNLNTATESDLQAFLFLTPLQIQQLLSYRRLLGQLIRFQELQAVPGWDLETIRRIQPFACTGSAVPVREDLMSRWKGGSHAVLLRYAQQLERQNGFIAFDSAGPNYQGSPARLVFRYKYGYRNSLQYGITADKDAGEPLFGRNKTGFDFYSAHLFIRNLGMIRSLAIGDFTINMGQGLISWQVLAFRKSAEVMAVKRQADLLRPYNAPGEYNFFRGAGMTVQKGNWSLTGFAAAKKESASQISDTADTDPVLVSLQRSGYHRTLAEIAGKGRIRRLTAGGNISYRNTRFQAGINTVYHRLSAALQPLSQPYRLFAAAGQVYSNTSLDYEYTYRNVHLFGEIAGSRNGATAMVSGLMASLDARADITLLYRNISRDYSSFYSNAFTESTIPVNEKGLYTGLTLRLVSGMTLNAYADVFSFPWLRYRIDRPSGGSAYQVQLGWRPNRQTELYSRYRRQRKAENLSGTNLPVQITPDQLRQNWRTHLVTQFNTGWILKIRAEILWLEKAPRIIETGFLFFTELFYKPLNRPFTGNIRLQYTETDSYDSRLYAFENDVLYSFSIPPSSGKNYRWYFNLSYRPAHDLTLWARIAQTYYPDASFSGTGNERVNTNHRTEVKIQSVYRF